MTLPEGFEVKPRPQPFRLADPIQAESLRDQAVSEFLSVFNN
jgi:hypothetical protein